MTPAKTRYTVSSIERLDSIAMSDLDREIARTQLRRAELFADLVVAAGAAIGAVLLGMKPVAAKHTTDAVPKAPV